MKYDYKTITDIEKISNREQITFGEVVLRSEMEQMETERETVIEKAKNRLIIFKKSIQAGLQNSEKTSSGMSGGQAGQMQQHKPVLLGSLSHKAIVYALAVNEANTKMFRIVACPTAGASGIVPGCMEAIAEVYGCTEAEQLDGFFVAAGIGNVITEQACVAGAVGGCQAEVGTASAMAAGAAVAMMKGSTEDIVHAMTIALKNVLGLVCDPVAGLVEVPCVKRNGIYALHALGAAEMAMAGIRSQIPADEVIGAMDTIGRSLPSTLRETSEGGLAMTLTGQKIAEQIKNL